MVGRYSNSSFYFSVGTPYEVVLYSGNVFRKLTYTKETLPCGFDEVFISAGIDALHPGKLIGET